MTQTDPDRKEPSPAKVLVNDMMDGEQYQLPTTKPPPYVPVDSNVQINETEIPRRRTLNTHGRIFFSIFAVTLLLITYLHPSGPFSYLPSIHLGRHHHYHHHHHSEEINKPCPKHKWHQADKGPKANHKSKPVPLAESQEPPLKSHHKWVPSLFSSCNTTSKMANSITGAYDLYGCLDLSTLAGSIDVVITVMPGQDPARLKLSAASGQVRVNVGFSPDGQPRQVNTDISTLAGPIFATIPIGAGSRTDLQSKSGMLDVKLLAFDVGYADPVSTVHTHTDAGWQRVVVEPMSEYRGPLANIEASHTASSGTLDVMYPPEWEGVVKAVAGAESGSSARLDAGCPDLIVDRCGKGKPGVSGHRGLSKHVIRVSGSGGGAVRFAC